MPWWSWFAIWAVLILALLGMLAWIGYRLFRKSTVVLAALGELSEKASLLQSRADSLDPQRAQYAIFDKRMTWVQLREERQALAQERRSIRSKSRVRRGKLLVTADPQQYSYLIRRN